MDAWITPGWAFGVLLVLATIIVALGAPLAPLVIFATVITILFAYRYPYGTFGLLVALVPFLGITVSLPTGELALGERAFGGAIDVPLVEVVALALLAAWAIKIFVLWHGRRDVSWKPWIPLALPLGALVAAHMLSAFSPFHPDKLLVIKYALRPVLWCMLAYVLLTANMIRSRRRLTMVLGVITTTGIFAALMGLASLGFPDGAGLLPRARPLPIFGLSLLGDNHNLLAEWLIVTIPSTLALILLVKDPRSRRLLAMAAVLQALTALLTFARTAWIVLTVEALCLGWFVWRERFIQWARGALIGLVFLLPVAAAMFAFSRTALVQSSTSTRVMLTQIAVSLWSASPWIGMGAGTFVDRVGATQVFLVEYGAPLDSHGWIQKLMAETGLIGLVAAAWLICAVFLFVRRARSHLRPHPMEYQVFTILAIAAFGALVYQLFNTSYWNAKMWLPLGVMLAASRALLPLSHKTEHDQPIEP